MAVGASILACCCDTPTNWPSCANANPADDRGTEYTLSFNMSVVYMDRFRPSDPSHEFDDVVTIYDPDRVPPGCTSPGAACPFTREYTPADYSFSAKLTHRTQYCPPTDGPCRVLRSVTGIGNNTEMVPGSTVTYVSGGTITQPTNCPGQTPAETIPVNPIGLPTASSLILVNGVSFVHPSYRISWGCNQASTIGGTQYFTPGAVVAHPGFGFYGPRMEIVMIEVGRMGLQTGCNAQGDPITQSVQMSHGIPTCQTTNPVNCCQYGRSTIVTYWRPLPSDPTAPGYCFTPGVFNLHTVFSPFRCFIVPPIAGLPQSIKTCTNAAPTGDPRRVYMGGSATACGGWNQPGQPNRAVGYWGLMRWSPALGETKPDVLNVTVPASITIS